MILTVTVEAFFNKYVFDWMFPDIENCIKAHANYAVAALLMIYTENIGSLIEGHLGLSKHAEADFNKFIEYFEFKSDSNYYKNFQVNYKESGSSSIHKANIYKAFRCGFIHEYAPKFPCEVVNHSDRIDHCTADEPGIGWVNPPPEYDTSSSSGYVPLKAGKPHLKFHTNAYFRDFKSAANRVYDRISKVKDPTLISTGEISLKRVLGRTLEI